MVKPIDGGGATRPTAIHTTVRLQDRSQGDSSQKKIGEFSKVPDNGIFLS
jgi:hypothetical protein